MNLPWVRLGKLGLGEARGVVSRPLSEERRAQIYVPGVVNSSGSLAMFAAINPAAQPQKPGGFCPMPWNGAGRLRLGVRRCFLAEATWSTGQLIRQVTARRPLTAVSLSCVPCVPCSK
jgi:hypothetical protein